VPATKAIIIARAFDLRAASSDDDKCFAVPEFLLRGARACFTCLPTDAWQAIDAVTLFHAAIRYQHWR